jgi:hypothetical protein
VDAEFVHLLIGPALWELKDWLIRWTIAFAWIRISRPWNNATIHLFSCHVALVVLRYSLWNSPCLVVCVKRMLCWCR